MAEISLLVDGQVFKANKDVLCKHSDYFRAMFSGNYVENDKQEISIQVIDAESMKTILDYMKTGSTVLYEYSLTNVEKLETAARFLLITELVKDIKYFLLSREIISVSQDPVTINPRDTQVEHGYAKYGIVPFKSMNIEYIPDITRLCWYLSHPCIDASSELDVFIFGYNWILQNKTGEDACEALLMILGCLDLKELTVQDLSAMKTHMKQYRNSMAARIVKYLHSLARCPGYDLSIVTITSSKTDCAETIYNETLKLVEENKSRYKYTPVATLVEIDKLVIYKLTEKGFEIWQELPGFCQFVFVVSWRLTKLVMVKENTKSIWVYDVLAKEWTCHGEGLWRGCHHGACVVGDSLFIINFSPESCTFSATIYDLEKRVFVTKAKTDYPKHMLSVLVQFCVHEGAIYAAIDGVVYKRDDLGSADHWSTVDMQQRIHRMMSFKGYIYCSMDPSIVILYRFRPGVDRELEQIKATLNQCPVHICNMGDRLLFLCNQPGWFIHGTRVDEFHENMKDKKLRELHINRRIEADNIISFCPLVVDIPLYSDMSNYVKEYLKKYEAVL